MKTQPASFTIPVDILTALNVYHAAVKEMHPATAPSKSQIVAEAIQEYLNKKHKPAGKPLFCEICGQGIPEESKIIFHNDMWICKCCHKKEHKADK
jgi:hypothetical protein